jgi:hypothetical protein
LLLGVKKFYHPIGTVLTRSLKKSLKVFEPGAGLVRNGEAVASSGNVDEAFEQWRAAKALVCGIGPKEKEAG